MDKLQFHCSDKVVEFRDKKNFVEIIRNSMKFNAVVYSLAGCAFHGDLLGGPGGISGRLWVGL